MHRIGTVVVGGGHAGLAMSRALTDAGRDHLVLERGRVAERWRSERWDSLQLLTPNWMSRLPSWQYGGDEPDGFMTTAAFVDHLRRYARSFEAPVHEHTAVRSVAPLGEGFRVTTDGGTWLADDVVVATGYCHRAAVPASAAGLDPAITELSPLDYRNPQSVPDGGVLVVGASSSGLQIAAELRRAGRDVVLAVGRHTRLPRRYRGRDVLAWLELLGALDRTVDDLPAEVARREPSLQLVASSGERALDLGVLQDAGVELAGRFTGADGSVVRFADDLPATVADADRRLRRVLGRIDDIAADGTRHDDVPPVRVRPGARRFNLLDRGIGTVVWATGFRGSWPWLHLPVVAPSGHIVQRRGRTAVPGLYTVGQRFQHRRSSSFIDGVRHDVADVLSHLTRTAADPVACAV
jgi:putative flavoprotein involved in K+ transport